MQKLLAVVTNPFGVVNEPVQLQSFGTDPGVAIGKLIQLAVQLLIIGAGIYALINFVLAGYAFLSSDGDPKKIEAAWAKIWQSALGLAIAAGSLTLAAIFGGLIFHDASFILTPVIPTL
jgi:hypothetical protein